jgi:hypothetical protein
VRAVAAGEPWSTNFDIYVVAAAGGTPRNLTADNPAWDVQPAFSRRRKARVSRHASDPDSSRTAFIWCSRL